MLILQRLKSISFIKLPIPLLIYLNLTKELFIQYVKQKLFHIFVPKIKLNLRLVNLFEKLVDNKKIEFSLNKKTGKVLKQIFQKSILPPQIQRLKTILKKGETFGEKASAIAKEIALKNEASIIQINRIKDGGGSDSVTSQWILSVEWIPKSDNNPVFGGSIVVIYKKNKAGGETVTAWYNQNYRLFLNFVNAGSKGNFYLTWFPVAKAERAIIAKHFPSIADDVLNKQISRFQLRVKGVSKDFNKSFKKRNTIAAISNRKIKSATFKALGGINSAIKKSAGRK
jgi:hypothetical protein